MHIRPFIDWHKEYISLYGWIEYRIKQEYEGGTMKDCLKKIYNNELLKEEYKAFCNFISKEGIEELIFKENILQLMYQTELTVFETGQNTLLELDLDRDFNSKKEKWDLYIDEVNNGIASQPEEFEEDYVINSNEEKIEKFNEDEYVNLNNNYYRVLPQKATNYTINQSLWIYVINKTYKIRCKSVHYDFDTYQEIQNLCKISYNILDKLFPSQQTNLTQH